MKASEIQIGDWLYYKGQFNAFHFKVESITKKKVGYHVELGDNRIYYIRLNEVQPIPLTSDILKKNGFEISCDFGNVYSLKEPQRFWAVYVSEGVYALGCQSIDSSFANIRYVHQLQHALRICGIEKEIEL